MATGFYSKGKNNLGLGNINLITDDINVVLLDTDLYNADLDNDEFQSDIPESAIIAEKTLLGKTLTNSVFDANDLTFSNLDSEGKAITAIALIKDTGANNTSLLIAYIDNDPEFIRPMAFIPDGEDFTITWDNGTNRIFKI